MTQGADEEQRGLSRTLRRLDALVEAVGTMRDPAGRETAREMLELVLDLHGLALARILSQAGKVSEGRALIETLAEDAPVRTIMLLHGLHPDDPETRLRKVIAAMRPHWGVRGARVEIVEITSHSARIHIHQSTKDFGTGSLFREIEDVLVDAAPDLDEILFDGIEEGARPKVSV
jgi:hypothetical protein